MYIPSVENDWAFSSEDVMLLNEVLAKDDSSGRFLPSPSLDNFLLLLKYLS